MPGYVSEVSYSGTDDQDFIEVAVPKGTDVSSYTVVIYTNNGSIDGTVSFGSVVQTVDQKDVYIFNASTPLPTYGSNEAVALVDDTGTVLQFISFSGNTVTATEGPASGMTSTSIGTAVPGTKSLETDDEGSSYFTQTVTNPGTIPCYAPGTLIDTPDGPRPVEALRVGDLVETLDHGPMPIRWVRQGDRPLDGVDHDKRPVLIRAGAFGPGRPARDLVVSPQHRILVGGGGQLEGPFAHEVFAPAKALTGLPRIRAMLGKRRITWHHFALDRHAVVTAEGCLSESLLLGPMVLRGLSARECRALTSRFGPAPDGLPLNGPPARPCLTVAAVRRFLAAPVAQGAAA